MSAEVESGRPNIRIQIVNNVSATEEKMEVDDNEEGEILDDTGIEQMEKIEENKTKPSRAATFTTGINIFDKQEKEKLQERARRFALKPDEIHSFNEEDMADLLESLGIKSSEDSEVKFKTIHLLGLGSMSAEDIVEYFASYAPEGIEWLDDNSCNVVWLDSLSCARALHFKSRVVRGMPARAPKDIYPKEFLDEVDEEESQNGQSILIKNRNREVELQNEIGEIIMPKKKTYPKNSVDISEVSIPIPPGYWRLGLEHPKAKCLLIRFGLITDKIPFKSEKCNKYYKKTGLRGISENKKKELKTIFERNKDFNQSKNPWGSLAKNWDKDAKFREREPVNYTEDDDCQIVQVKNPSLQARLGSKRTREESESDGEVVEEEPEVVLVKSTKSKFKVPRMKMYADEEEENQKKRKILMKIKKQTEEIDKRSSDRDLRNMLGPSNRLLLKDNLPQPEQSIDLASKLKNRSQRMIFAVERDLFPEYHYEDIPRLDRRQMIDDRRLERTVIRSRERSPVIVSGRSVLLRSRLDQERVRPRSPRRIDRTSRRRTPERTLHSDRLAPSRRRQSSSPEQRHTTRSKVAVVVKSPKKPTVASTIWSKVKKASESEESSSGSESESESLSSSPSSSSSGSESSESDSDDNRSNRRLYSAGRNPDRPGFDKSRLSGRRERTPMKVMTMNDRFRRNRR